MIGMKQAGVILAMLLCCSFLGCKKEATYNYQQLVQGAQKEGELFSLAMPGEWANWKETWQEMNIYYGIKHADEDMNSGDELIKFAAGTGDIGDVGYSFGAQAEHEELTAKFKTSYWDEIPEWAKDDDGDWIVPYTGTLAFMVKDGGPQNKLSWKSLVESKYTVGTSDVRTSSQAQYTVYAANIALGGTKNNIQPGIALFKKLAQEHRLTDALHDQETSLNSHVDVNIKWDFVALGYRDRALEQGKHYAVNIPADGSITVGYASIINKKAKHPMAARLAREYILSDSGQYNLAKGYAMPIRAIVLPKALEAKRIPRNQYNEKMIKTGLEYDADLGKKIVQAWTEQVLPILEEKGRVL